MKKLSLNFLTGLFFITHITYIYLIYDIFAQPEMTLNFEKCRYLNCFKILYVSFAPYDHY